MNELQQTTETGLSEQYKEISQNVLSSQIIAQVKSRFLMAIQKPRDYDMVREKILKHCKRSSFSASAIYRKPVDKGRTVDGLSIRFAETAIREMGNLGVEVISVFDDDFKRTVRVTCTDFENNVSYFGDVTVTKTVERRSPSKDDVILSHRINSNGTTVFTIVANEDQLLIKQAALVSKMIRTLGLRLVPADILEDCMEAIRETMRSGINKDPNLEKKKILDSFTLIGVTSENIKKYLGYPLESITKEDILRLRELYSGIKNGEVSIKEVFYSDQPEEQTSEPEPEPEVSVPTKKKA